MIPPSMEVGRAIARARERRGWSQSALLSHLDERRHKSTISEWERGLGIGIGSLLEVIAAMPEVGDHVVAMIRRAQQR
jgi:ribosome-binding protein aMBF1 (putative translation factor)